MSVCDAVRSVVDDEREEERTEQRTGRVDLAPHEPGCDCCATAEDWS